MGCNCGKKRKFIKDDNNEIVPVKKGTMSSRIKKIWKLSNNDNSVVVKKVDNK